MNPTCAAVHRRVSAEPVAHSWPGHRSLLASDTQPMDRREGGGEEGREEGREGGREEGRKGGKEEGREIEREREGGGKRERKGEGGRGREGGEEGEACNEPTYN